MQCKVVRMKIQVLLGQPQPGQVLNLVILRIIRQSQS
jgi:hypothetical protein